MSKRLILLIGCMVCFSLLFNMSCNRDAVADPDFGGNAGFDVILSGTANPSILYVPQNSSDTSIISVVAKTGSGAVLAWKEVIFQIFSADGTTSPSAKFMESGEGYIKRQTDANGIAAVTLICRSIWITGPETIFVKATYVDDHRIDHEDIYDIIPVNIVTNKMLKPVFTAFETTTQSTNIGVTAAATTFSIIAFNSGNDESISFVIAASDTWLTSSATSGITDATFTVNVDANATGFSRTGWITLTVTAPSSLIGNTVTIFVTQDP